MAALPRETSPIPVSGHSIFLRVMQCTLFYFLGRGPWRRISGKRDNQREIDSQITLCSAKPRPESEDRDRFTRKSLTFEAGYYELTYRIAIHEMQSSGLSYYIILTCFQPGADEEPQSCRRPGFGPMGVEFTHFHAAHKVYSLSWLYTWLGHWCQYGLQSETIPIR